MNTKIILIGVGILIVVLWAVIFFVIFIAPKTTSTANTNPNPFGTPPPSNNAGGDAGSYVPPPSSFGQTASSSIAFDFTTSTGVASSTQGYFYVLYPATTTDEISEQTQYGLYYLPDKKSYLMYLYKEPLGAVRAAAMLDLESRLGMSPTDICSLNYEVIVPNDVSTIYSAKNLGFPGCPGATLLPGN